LQGAVDRGPTVPSPGKSRSYPGRRIGCRRPVLSVSARQSHLACARWLRRLRENGFGRWNSAL